MFGRPLALVITPHDKLWSWPFCIGWGQPALTQRDNGEPGFCSVGVISDCAITSPHRSEVYMYYLYTIKINLTQVKNLNFNWLHLNIVHKMLLFFKGKLKERNCNLKVFICNLFWKNRRLWLSFYKVLHIYLLVSCKKFRFSVIYCANSTRLQPYARLLYSKQH